MSYLDQTRRPSPTSMAAVIAIHAGIGVALVTGLSIAGEVIEREKIPSTFDLKDPPPPPPEVPPEAPPEAATPPSSPPITAPQPKLDLKPTPPSVDVRDLVVPPMPPVPVPRPSPSITPQVVPTTTPRIDPVAAAPRNDPSRWVTTSDYRSNWINREMVGTARFRLEIAANGSVQNCTITGSTGHGELDRATCNLVSRRAKFQPARGSDGEPVAGSYSSAVRWVVPE